jgi:hypothetical protein
MALRISTPTVLLIWSLALASTYELAIVFVADCKYSDFATFESTEPIEERVPSASLFLEESMSWNVGTTPSEEIAVMFEP